MSVCNKAIKLITEARERDLLPAEAQFLKEHSSVCPVCAEHLAAFKTVTALMPTLLPPEVKPPIGFTDRLHERLIEQSGRLRWYAYLPHFRFRPAELAVLIMLLLCAVGIAAYFTFSEETREPQLITEQTVPADTPISIDLEYLAVRHIPTVTVTIELGEGVRFYSDYPEIAESRSHTWQGSFREGMNTLPFMVKVDRAGVWKIHTRADFEGRRHEHLIMLTSTGKTVTVALYRLPSIPMP